MRRGCRRSWPSARARRPPKSRFAPYAPFVALGRSRSPLVALGVGLFVNGLGTRASCSSSGFGTIALFIGFALLAPRLVKPLAAIVGWPAQRFGGMAGELARENAVRNPSRTASTAAALMIGLALVTVVAVLGAALRDSTQAVADQVAADYVVTSMNGFDPLPASEAALGGEDSPRASASTRRWPRRTPESQRRRPGDDRDLLPSRGRRAPMRRSALGNDGAIVTEAFARIATWPWATAPLRDGERHSLASRELRPVPRALLAGSRSARSLRRDFPRPATPSRSSTRRRRRRHSNRDGRDPDAKRPRRGRFVTSRTTEFSTILNLLYVLLAFSVVVSLFGMVNTLVLSVFERTR